LRKRAHAAPFGQIPDDAIKMSFDLKSNQKRRGKREVLHQEKSIGPRKGKKDLVRQEGYSILKVKGKKGTGPAHRTATCKKNTVSPPT